MARYRRAGLKNKKSKRNLSNSKVTAISSTVDHEAKATFLDLTGEIRNAVYKHCLLQSETIDVHKGTFNEPGLLLTCRQIRTETLKIFYLDNSWRIFCQDWDCSLRQAFYQHVKTRESITDITGMGAFWNITGDYYNRTNTLNFIKTLHEDETQRGIYYDLDKAAQETAITGAFAIASRMRKWDWKDILEVLEIYLDEVAKSKDGWTWT